MVVVEMALATVSAINWGVMANGLTPKVMGHSHLGMFGLDTMATWVLSVALMAAATAVSGVVAKAGRGCAEE